MTTSDLDFEQRTISINKQLLRRNDGSRYIQRMTKTKAGMRTLFMSDAVSESLHNMIREREKQKVSPVRRIPDADPTRESCGSLQSGSAAEKGCDEV